MAIATLGYVVVIIDFFGLVAARPIHAPTDGDLVTLSGS